MDERKHHTEGKRVPATIFLLSVISFLFTASGIFLDVYRFAITGALFEVFWLPMILCILTLPVISLFFLIRDKFNFRSHYFYSFVIALATILMLIFLSEQVK